MRSSFWKTKIDGQAWLLNDTHEVETEEEEGGGRRRKTRIRYEYLQFLSGNF